jgi:hypothetical protein
MFDHTEYSVSPLNPSKNESADTTGDRPAVASAKASPTSPMRSLAGSELTIGEICRYAPPAPAPAPAPHSRDTPQD